MMMAGNPIRSNLHERASLHCAIHYVFLSSRLKCGCFGFQRLNREGRGERFKMTLTLETSLVLAPNMGPSYPDTTYHHIVWSHVAVCVIVL